MSRWGSLAAVLACLAGATLLNQSAVHWRANAVDDHLFAWHGWCVAQGARPYLDVWDNKPPGLWWLNAAAFRALGDGVVPPIVICAPAVALTLAAFVDIARRAFQRGLTIPAALLGGVLLLHPILEFGGNRTETFVVACETTAVWAFVRGQSSSRGVWFLIAGVAAGTAPLFKQSGLGAAAAIAVGLAASALWGRASAGQSQTVRRAARSATLVAVGYVLPVAAALVALAASGALGAACNAVVTFNRAYFAVNDATWLRMGDALGVYAPVFRPLSGFLVAAGIGVGAALVLTLRRSERFAPGARRAMLLFAVWFFVDAYLACVAPGRRGHHFLPAVPALGLLALAPLHVIAGREGLLAAMARRTGAIVVLLLYALVLGSAANGAAGEFERCWNQKRAWWSVERRVPTDVEAQADEIRRRTAPTDEIYVWGWSPGTYRFAYRLCPSRFATLEKLGQVGEHAAFIRAGAMADVMARPPRIFVISPRDLVALPAAQPEFAAWLESSYARMIEVRGNVIMERRR